MTPRHVRRAAADAGSAAPEGDVTSVRPRPFHVARSARGSHGGPHPTPHVAADDPVRRRAPQGSPGRGSSPPAHERGGREGLARRSSTRSPASGSGKSRRTAATSCDATAASSTSCAARPSSSRTRWCCFPEVLEPFIGRAMHGPAGVLVSVPSRHELVFAPVDANIAATLVHQARYTLMTDPAHRAARSHGRRERRHLHADSGGTA